LTGLTRFTGYCFPILKILSILSKIQVTPQIPIPAGAE